MADDPSPTRAAPAAPAAPPAPTPRVIATHSFEVRPSDCDPLGHMNVARYFDGCSDAGFYLQGLWTLTPEDITAGRRIAFVVLSAESRFLRELRVGDRIDVRSHLAHMGTKSLRVMHRFFHEDAHVFETQFTLVLMDLTARAAMVIPPDLRQAIEAAHGTA
ncbi:MAG: thioesterase family protein [Pseudomonadota bacterium]